MQFAPTRVDGAFVVRTELRSDERGSFARTFCADEFAAAGIDFIPVQCNLSHNTARHTLRGLHFQHPPHAEAKLVQCVAGAIFDTIADLRPASPTFGLSAWVELSADGGELFYIPPGCAHGFLTLCDNTDVLYYMGSRYAAGAEAGVSWNDPALQIPWPAPPARIAQRDADYPTFAIAAAALAR